MDEFNLPCDNLNLLLILSRPSSFSIPVGCSVPVELVDQKSDLHLTIFIFQHITKR